MTQSSTPRSSGTTSPQAILFSGNFAIWPLCHERQLCPSAMLPQGVTSPQGSVEPPCSVRTQSTTTDKQLITQTGLRLACFTKPANCMTLPVWETIMPMQRSFSFTHFCLKLVCKAKHNQRLHFVTRQPIH